MASRSWHKAGLTLIVGVIVGLGGVGAAQAVTFRALSSATPGGGAVSVAGIVANSISPDASLVAGSAVFDGNGRTAALYNVATNTIYNLGAPGFGGSEAVGVGIRSTGEVCVAVNGANLLGFSQAFLWLGDATGVGSYTGDVILDVNGNNSTATSLAVQLDDEVMICGNWLMYVDEDTTIQRGFRYGTTASWLNIDKPPNSDYPTRPYGMSAFDDVGGFSLRCNVGGGNHANAWICTRGTYTWINTIAGTINSLTQCRADGPQPISLDGLHVVGRSTVIVGEGNPWRAFMSVGGVNASGWANVIDLGVLPGRPNPHDYSEATAVNGYGTVVAGYSQTISATPNDRRYVIWDATNGMRDLLTLAGNPAGWELTGVKGLSEDGATAIGSGTNGYWIMTGIYDPPLPPPPPDITPPTPNPQSWIAGQAYTKDLVLSAGRLPLPLPTWSILQGPVTTVVPAGKGATVSGWTPTAANIGTPVTIEVQASTSRGSDSETWTVNVTPPPAPRIVPQLIVDATSIAVNNVLPFATEVAVYKNGVKTYWRTYPGDGSTPSSVTFNADDVAPAGPVAPLVLNDWYEAEQTTGGAASAKWPASSAPYRMVLPAVMSFADGFETGTGGPGTYPRWWLRHDMPLVTQPPAQVHTGAYAADENVTSLTASASDFADVTAGAPDGAYRNPVVYEFWMYENAINTTTGSRHYGGIYQYGFGGWEPGVTAGKPADRIQYILEIGTFPDRPGFVVDEAKYQCYVVVNGVGFTSSSTSEPPGVYPNLADPLAPARSAGWHKFSIVAGANVCWFYVDGKRGLRLANVSPSKLDVVRVGNDTGSPDYDPSIPGSGNAYYDDVFAAVVTQHDPTLTLLNITGTEGQPISPTNEIASDADTPDTVRLVMSGTPLPAGLTASATSLQVGSSPTAGPTATITITGAPFGGTAGHYTDIVFTVTDDLDHMATGSITIDIEPGNCSVPTVTSFSPGDGAQGSTVPMTAVGTNFVDGDTTVKLRRTGQSDIIGINPVVTGGTSVAADLNLTGAAIGMWNVVVATSCGEAIAPTQFEVSISCPAPTVSAISPNVGVQDRSNVRPHPPYDGVTVPNGLVHATITGAGFVAGATVKLTRSGLPDIVATNVVVVGATQITCDVDLSGAAPGSLNGAWDVVVTTCGEGRLPGGFTVSMCFTPAQDSDGDGDVDLADFGVFQNCFNGPNRPYKLPPGYNKECYCLDIGDNPVLNDVDLSDFNTFQGCFNGPNRRPKIGC